MHRKHVAVGGYKLEQLINVITVINIRDNVLF